MISINLYAVGDGLLHKKHRRSKKLYEILSEICEIPQDIIANIPVFTIRGTHEIEISGCTGILTYDSHRVVVSIGNNKETFCVCGDELMLSDFRDRILYIRGNIRSATFGTGDVCDV